MTPPLRDGYEKLWRWFGLSRASFVVMPRALMHAMPDEWQGKMADLLTELGDQFSNMPITEYDCRAKKNGKYVAMPESYKNYRYPHFEEIEAMK